MPDPHRVPVRAWPAPVRALAHPAFQVYFTGQAVSTLGKWVQQVALAWLAYHLTDSPTLLGVIAFVTLAPQLLIGPIAGAWTDRHDKRRLLIAVQTLLALQSLALAGLAYAHLLDASSLVGMALLLGLLNAFETPLRQALIGSFVADPADLPNALVLNAMLINAARFVGPPLAGALIAWAGEALCFLLTALAFSALLVGLLKVRGSPASKASGSTREVFREGLRYLWGHARCAAPDGQRGGGQCPGLLLYGAAAGAGQVGVPGRCADLGLAVGRCRRGSIRRHTGAGL